MADKGAKKRVIDEELQRFWPLVELKKRESRSRGYLEGYDNRPFKPEETEEWKQGWKDGQESIGK